MTSHIARYLPRALSMQAIWFLAAALLLSTVLAGPIAHSHFSGTLTADLLKQGKTLAQTLEKHSDLRLSASLGDGGQASSLLASTAEADEDILYIALLNAGGSLVAFGPKTFDKDELTTQLTAILHNNASDGHDSEHGTYYFVQPISKTQDALGDALALGAAAPDSRGAGLGTIVVGLSDRNTRQRVWVVTAAAVAAVSLVLFNIFILLHMRWVSSRVFQMAEFARRMTAGDLSVSIDDVVHDDLGSLSGALRTLLDGTTAVVRGLTRAATELNLASSELLQSASRQAGNTSTQAGSVAQMGATVSQLRETFLQATNRAEAVIDLARRSEESSTGGAKAVRDSIDEMSHIREQILAIAQTIKDLVQRTDQIDAIIEVVNDLAEQSNVLAINAGIEAAKAAEYGRGFGVVAREVRSLAERSKESTSQVKSILQDIQVAGREAISVIEEGRRRAESGSQVASAAGDSIQRLGEAIAASSAAAMQIATSTRQQSAGVDQIWQATREIDRIALETASGVTSIQTAANELDQISKSLSEIVGRYRTE